MDFVNGYVWYSYELLELCVFKNILKHVQICYWECTFVDVLYFIFLAVIPKKGSFKLIGLEDMKYMTWAFSLGDKYCFNMYYLGTLGKSSCFSLMFKQMWKLINLNLVKNG